MEPVAYIILSSLPGENRLKNLKYFLGRGDNVVGSNPRCQIALPEKYEMMHYIANIRIGHNFLTIQALHPNLIYVESNITKSQRQGQVDNYFPLAANVQYLPKIGEYFYIGRVKAVIGIASSSQLAQMKMIVNNSLFNIPSDKYGIKFQPYQQFNMDVQKNDKQWMGNKSKQRQIDFGNTIEQNQIIPMHFKQRRQYQQNFNEKKIFQKRSANKQAQIPIEDDNKSKTELLDNQQYQIQPTIFLEEGIYANEPTLNLDDPFQPFHQPIKGQQSNVNVGFSQEILMNEIRKQNQNQNQAEQQGDGDFSMPDTIKDNQQIKPMFHQIESKQQNPDVDDDDQMPATIKQEEVASKIKLTKTMKMPVRRIQQHHRLYKSDHIPKQGSNISEASQNKPIQDFMDLLGVSVMQISTMKHQNSEPVIEQQSSLIKMSSMKVSTFEKSSLQQSLKKQQLNIKEDKKRVHIVGFKPTPVHRKFLKQQNMDIVEDPEDDYELLLVKQPLRQSNRLLLALINGKRIQSEQWIFNKNTQIQSKLNGLTWKQIYEKRNTHTNLLNNKRFYITKRLEQLFQNVIQSMGGIIIDQLVDKKRVLHVVLRTEDSQDTETYLNNKDNKKWKFLRSEAIVDCVLTGKFNLQGRHLINLFPK